MTKFNPIRSTSHLMEEQSQRQFEKLISPWANQGWNPKDYGIDTTIEIFSEAEIENGFLSDAKIFMVQLKATKKKKLKNGNLSMSIPTRKIFYWYSLNVPLLYVVHDQNNNQFFSIWIDEEFINTLENKNVNWSNKDSISIQFSPNELLNKNYLDIIKKYVFVWEQPIKKILEPGKFFELKTISENILHSYKNIIANFQFKSVTDHTNFLYNKLEQSIYRISITGFSRVGKSSFINKFLDSGKREISPTGIFQTTGVPIQFLPRSKEKVKIEFQDKPSINTKFSEKIIEKYVSQDYNEANHKKVTTVTISLKNNQLEKGISIFDIPGLDDPDDNIFSYTNATIAKSNAILYLIDGSAMEHGGYIFNRHHKKNIEQFGKKLDRIFFIVSKVDTLSKRNLEKLKKRVWEDLDKFNLTEIIGNKIYFISNKKSKPKYDNIDSIRKDIWAFMLHGNKYGVKRLADLNADLSDGINDFSDLLNVRLLDRQKKIKLVESLNSTKNKVPKLEQMIIARRDTIYIQLRNSLQNRKNILLDKLEEGLKKVPLSKQLPNSITLRNFLHNGVSESIELMNKENGKLVNDLKSTVDEWVELNLKQLRNLIHSNSEKRIISFKEIETYKIPSDEFSPTVGFSMLSLAVGILFNVQALAFGGLFTFIGNLLNNEEKRKSKIAKIVTDAKRRYNIAFLKIETELKIIITQNLTNIAEYVDKKLNTYFEDMETQIENLDIDLNEIDYVKYNEAIKKLSLLSKEIEEHQKNIEGFLVNI